LVNVAAPPTTVHRPVPGEGLLPVKLTVGEVEQTEVVLAFAVAATLTLTVIVISLKSAGQPDLVTVQRKVVVPVGKLLTVEVLEFILPNVMAPFAGTTVQVPVSPAPTAVAAKVVLFTSQASV